MTGSRLNVPQTSALDQTEAPLLGANDPPTTDATLPMEGMTAGPASQGEKDISEIIGGPWLAMRRAVPVVVEAADVCVYYARFSSDKQHESSIERQVEGSDVYVKYHRLTVMPGNHIFADRGKSGAFIDDREALAAMLEAADMKKFNKVLVENLDRLSRNLVDVLEIHRKFKQLGIELHVTGRGASAGRVDDVDAVFHGMVAMLHRERMMELTGLGRWRAAMRGRNVSAIPYGYRPTDEPGLIEINEKEAAVVRRIYDLYDKGLKPLRIAQVLNAEGVPSPCGKQWSVSTLIGASVSAKGILRNPRYAGIYVYGTSTSTTTEVNGRKTTVRGVRPQKDWVYVAVPEWRIIDKELWARTMIRLKSTARSAPFKMPELREKTSGRHTLLLHGNYFCHCGSRMKGLFNSTSNRRSLTCYDAGEKGTCPETRSISATFVEIETLRQIRDHVLSPTAIDAFVEDYIRGSHELEEARRNRRAFLETRIEELGAFIRRTFEGAENRDVVAARGAWNSERAGHEAELQALPTPKEVPYVDPASVASLRQQIDALILRTPFAARTAEDLELCAAMRRLVPRVVVHREPDKAGYRLDITASYGALAVNHIVALEAGLPVSIHSRTCPAPTRGTPNAEELLANLRDHVRNETFFVGEADWRTVEHSVDEPTPHPPRRIVDAILLSLRTGASVRNLPAPYGGQSMDNAWRRFVTRGLWRKVLRALQAIDSPAVASLDTSRFAYIERNLDTPPLT